MHKRFLNIASVIIILSFIFLNAESSGAASRKHHPQKSRAVSINKKSNIKDNSFHIVKKGENLYQIGKLHGLSVDELKELNGLKNSKLKIGQRLILENSPSPLSSPQRGEGWVRGEEEMPPEKRTPEEIAIAKKIELLEDIPNNQISDDASVKEEDKSVIVKVLSYSRNLLGTPYRFGGTTLRAIDCSAFVQKVFKIIDIDLPRTAREQYKIGKSVDREEITEGDLVFFKTYSRRFPSHVGIYIGDNQFIHASRKGRQVSIDSLDEPYYSKRFIGAKRLIEAEVTAEPREKDKSG